MEVLAKYGRDDVAFVYLARTSNGALVEFVESVQPPIPRDKKWVLIVSSMEGCPIGCAMCDAGGYFKRKLSKDEILEQVRFLVDERYGSTVPVEKFKIQFARVGEPALNDAVLDVLEELPTVLDAPGLMPSISTVAPAGREGWFERLLSIKERHYRGRFQLQFSIHSTDEVQRNEIVPVRKWSFSEIADYGRRFVSTVDRKVTLNFALASQYRVDAEVIARFFDPDKFLVKITPVNPTYRAKKSGLTSDVSDDGSLNQHGSFVEELKRMGFDVIVSVGELEENKIGSNCGQYVQTHLRADEKLTYGYDIVS